MSDRYCERCGRFHDPNRLCPGVRNIRREVDIQPWAFVAFAILALIASYAIGYWVGHSTPPGAM